MRRGGSAVLLVVAALALAGCGGENHVTRRVLAAFFAGSDPRLGRLGALFPHRPGTIPCTISVPGSRGKPLEADCATDVSLVSHDRAVVTLTETWQHGGLAHTWFFFIRRNGVVESVIQEGAPAPQAPQR